MRETGRGDLHIYEERKFRLNPTEKDKDFLLKHKLIVDQTQEATATENKS